jgi:TolB-like protein/DNA-binding CsgD family transcriptional regulator/Flp pilus assembly protein TadD
MAARSPVDKPLLTPRQLEVLELLAKGLTNREIAGVLEISPGTARNHVSAVIEALDVTNRTEAAVALQEMGLGRERPEESDARFRVPGFGGRPAIAVLPFENLSDDRELDFLADGLVEELTTRLACYRWFPVIARNSAFAYKGQHVDVREVSRDLGARYVVEGSLRSAADGLRVTVQVVDGTSGEHVWADRYDWTRDRLFRLQDEVVDAIVGSLDPAVSRIERLRVVREPPRVAGAWESFQRGQFQLYRETRESIEAAQSFFASALEADPYFAPAHTGLALTHCFLLVNGWSASPAESIAAADAAARRSIEADPEDPVAQATHGLVLFLVRQVESARVAFEQAIALNPSYAVAHWGLAAALLERGDPSEPIALLRKAIRLSPRDPVLHHEWAFLGLAYLAADRPDEALGCAEESRRLRDDVPYGHALAAACYSHLDRLPEARAAMAAARAAAPGFGPDRVRPFLPERVTEILSAGWARVS